MLDQDVEPQVNPRRRRWRIGVAAVVSVVVAAAVAAFVIFKGADRTLELEVTALGGQASSVNWSAPDDGYKSHSVHGPLDLPWRTTIDVQATDGVIRLNALLANGGWVTCRILRDGVVVAEEKAPRLTGCMVSVKRAFA